MSDISPAKNNIQIEETRFRAAVSEGTWQKIGGSINFINDFQYDTKEFFLNGSYNVTGANETFVDGLYIVPPAPSGGTLNVSIFAVSFFSIIAGSSGTTTVDVKYATASGGSFTSIFTTKPAISTAASHPAWVYTGSSGTGLTAPVLTGATIDLTTGNALRIDFTGKQSGSPQNCGLSLYMRPR